MPLLKLWNSIRGRSASTEPSNEPASAATRSPVAAEPRQSRSRATKGSRLGLFGGSGPHAPLRKLVKPLQAKTVLEISVGDGSRAIAVMQTLANQPAVQPPLRYVAIDQFEMVGGETSLKAFHQALRNEGIRPQVFPESINRGLIRVANTIGTVDLVVVAAKPMEWQTPETLSLLTRVLHEQTVVLYQDEEAWERYAAIATNTIRRAA